MNENLFSFSAISGQGEQPKFDSTAFDLGSDVNAPPPPAAVVPPAAPAPSAAAPVANAPAFAAAAPVVTAPAPAAAAPMATAPAPAAAAPVATATAPAAAAPMATAPAPAAAAPMATAPAPAAAAPVVTATAPAAAAPMATATAPAAAAPVATAPAPAAAAPVVTAPAPAATTADATNNVVPFAPPAQESNEGENPLLAMMDLQETKNIQAANTSLFAQLPQFSYNGTTEVIENLDQTFEELREAKAEDFTELEEAASVTWNITYGAVTKKVAKPKKTKIGELKREIETSKAFLDGLKKSTTKKPACIVKPSVTMKPKGIALYKGVFLTMEEAEDSGKTITFIPSGDGLVYERRVTEAGEFVTPASKVKLLDKIIPGFVPALPRIPYALFSQALALFRYMMDAREDGTPLEALVHIYWDKEDEKFILHVPRQSVGHAIVLPDVGEEPLDSDRYIHYADLHSHNDMDARFSAVDDRDERANRIYMVVGHLENYFPDLTVRICNGGTHWLIPADTVLEPFPTQEFPHKWLERIQMMDDTEHPDSECFDMDEVWGKAA